MRKIIYGIALSLSFTSFAFASSPAILDNNAIDVMTPPELKCVTNDMYVVDVNYGSVTSCAGTYEDAQNEWENVRQQLIKAVREASTGIN